jgi:hypothetical protein
MVLFIADLFHPISRLPIELFLDGYMSHGCSCSCAMPMLFTWWNPDYITWMDFFFGTIPALDPTASICYNQSLTKRMSMPCSTGTRLKCNISTNSPCWIVCLKQRVNSNITSEIFFRPFGRMLLTNSFDVHYFTPLSDLSDAMSITKRYFTSLLSMRLYALLIS